MEAKASTPMMQQYIELKDKYKDTILFYRMGDFYEMFYEDATKAAKILDIALTKRGKDKGQDIPMCGVPFHAYESYLEKLIKSGHKVAICEQLETPEEAKKRGYKAVVKRDVVRVVTKATVTEDNLLKANEENNLIAISGNKTNLTIAILDISTGKFTYENISINIIEAKLLSLSPKEILISDKLLEDKEFRFLFEDYQQELVNFPDSYFAEHKNSLIIKDFYQINNLDAIGNYSKEEVSVIGAVINYLITTQKDNLTRLPYPKSSAIKNYLEIDKTTLKSLELFHSSNHNQATLIHFIDKTKTASAARYLRQMIARPSTNLKLINNRLDKVSFFFKDKEEMRNVRDILKLFPDLERIIQKFIFNKANARDGIMFVNGIKIFIALSVYFKDNLKYKDIFIENIQEFSEYEELLKQFDIFVDSPPLLNREGNFIKEGISEELDYYRNIKNNAAVKIAELEEKYRKETQITNLKIKATNILGYYIEINSKFVDKMQGEIFFHKQTLANNMRYSSNELEEIQQELFNSKNKAIEIECNLFADLNKVIHKNIEKIQKSIKSIIELDIFSNFAFIALENDFSCPIVEESNILDIENGFHPIVKKFQDSKIQDFITNHCKLDEKNKFSLITGPNMAGKSTYIRQNALMVILAQIGCYVPAKQAKIGIVDKVFSRVGASDDLSKGRSTFMVEMIETATIINNATNKSFIILDEIGRGTSTYDGLSLAWSITEHIHNKINARTLFATHYHELTELKNKLAALSCFYSEAIEEDNKVIFKYKIIAGVIKKSYGIAVASLAGMPKSIIKRAEAILSQLEQDKPNNNLPLFEAQYEMIEKEIENNVTNCNLNLLDEISNLDLDNMTPKNTQEYLYDLKRKITNK